MKIVEQIKASESDQQVVETIVQAPEPTLAPQAVESVSETPIVNSNVAEQSEQQNDDSSNAAAAAAKKKKRRQFKSAYGGAEEDSQSAETSSANLAPAPIAEEPVEPLVVVEPVAEVVQDAQAVSHAAEQRHTEEIAISTEVAGTSQQSSSSTSKAKPKVRRAFKPCSNSTGNVQSEETSPSTEQVQLVTAAIAEEAEFPAVIRQVWSRIDHEAETIPVFRWVFFRNELHALLLFISLVFFIRTAARTGASIRSSS